MTRLRFLLVLAVLFSMAGSPAAFGQEVGPVDVIVVEGPLDGLAIDFVEASLQRSVDEGAQVAIIQLDSPGAVDAGVLGLIALFRQPPLPLAVWVGDAPAVAYGGAAQLLLAAGIRTAAPGVEIGNLTPTVAGSPSQAEVVAAPRAFLANPVVEVDGPIAGLVDEALPSIGQVVVWLNGREVSSSRGAAVLQTARETIGEDGGARLIPIAEVRFHEPGLPTRILRVAVRPEAAFFFVVIGLSVAAFEFFAVGPGLAAAVGVVSILIGGYGLAVLPTRWWALLLIGLGLLAYTAEFQRRSFGVFSVLATAGLLSGGLFLTDAGPQIHPSPWGVGLTVAAAIFFYLIAMPVVARARFSTGTIGREYLVGRPGSAVTELAPEGVVEVDGARWRARSHREAGIKPGDAVVVEAVEGLTLSVDREKLS